ncbi:hypothetical protein KL86PLE_100303 [uncultured Pleomorphomonas sp.]|uniref:HTH cro/C1-type domain-containing protein n=1 Tax=uncultured Pleomorphomonas sp. TaxID=442121 RepID=A0A212L2A2_9HYPH|nr:helix-turn-helix transcriptional regulator [uncultured Pleomorphomonas sp.]SCM71670.1 hypothetical protein KL86PLE_100303 [uncultured Pleomorphomonas sp.]
MTNEAEAGAVERQPYPQFMPKNELTAAMGRRLRAAREAAGKTIKEMCELLGTEDKPISINAYRKYESGAISMRSEMLIAAAAHLGCDPADLIVTTDQPN